MSGRILMRTLKRGKWNQIKSIRLPPPSSSFHVSPSATLGKKCWPSLALPKVSAWPFTFIVLVGWLLSLIGYLEARLEDPTSSRYSATQFSYSKGISSKTSRCAHQDRQSQSLFPDVFTRLSNSGNEIEEIGIYGSLCSAY